MDYSHFHHTLFVKPSSKPLLRGQAHQKPIRIRPSTLTFDLCEDMRRLGSFFHHGGVIQVES